MRNSTRACLSGEYISPDTPGDVHATHHLSYRASSIINRGSQSQPSMTSTQSLMAGLERNAAKGGKIDAPRGLGPPPSRRYPVPHAATPPI